MTFYSPVYIGGESRMSSRGGLPRVRPVIEILVVAIVLSSGVEGFVELIDRIKIARSGIESLPPTVVPPEVTILVSENLPSNKDYLPEVGNGHVATVVQSDTIFMNGLYNGANHSSHRARIPSPAGYAITSISPPTLRRSYSLDLGRGVFSETYEGECCNITLRTYAHRLFRSTLVTELTLSGSDNGSLVSAFLNLSSNGYTPDIILSNEEEEGVLRGVTREAEYPDVATTTEFYMKVSPSLKGLVVLSPGNSTQTYLSLTVIDVLRDHVEEEYGLALKSFYNGTLLASHIQEWNKVWTNGRIDVEGDTNVAKLNYASLYYILSSLPFDGGRSYWPFVGLSPGGLARELNKSYNGHVYWDQEIWMFPPIALLYPDLGRTIVETRTRTLNSARRHAQMTGWQGARYPWESAYTGLETSTSEQSSEYQVHISGDVSFMVRQYWQLTLDSELMVNGSGAELVWETAKYWCSRATFDSDKNAYRILEVIPPDEWPFPVNDSAYTNSIAAINLQFANQLAKQFGMPENATWQEVGNNLYLPYDPALDFHPEFDGFSIAQEVKQADVILLGYPLGVSMNVSTRTSDMNIYERLTSDGNSPAMAKGMFLVGWLGLGNETKAAEFLANSIQHAQQPFMVWSVKADGTGFTNFITGMGGYLQSVLFGYGGGRLHDDIITFNPKLIPGTTKVKFTGLNYRGCSFDLEYSADLMTLSLTLIESDHRSLDVLFQERANWEQMIVGQDIEMKRQGFTIRSSQ